MTMAQAMNVDSLTISVRYNSSTAKPLTVDRNWTICRFKEEIGKTFNIAPEEVNLIFQGKQLDENMPIKNLDLGNFSVLHAVKHRGFRTNLPTLDVQSRGLMLASGVGSVILKTGQRNGNGNHQGHMEAIQEDDVTQVQASTLKKQYYVYCRVCKDVKAGKLRVGCNKCKLSTLTIDKDPTGWDDVLRYGKISGYCHSENCNGNKAEFYFKCASHDSNEGERQACLPQVMTNNRAVPCITCEDILDAVLVFPCESTHCICLDCFTQYCTVKLNDRAFTQTDQHGYTLPCPGAEDSCRRTYIEDGHYFRILGEEQYKRFQNFATEECVLQMGGLLCPRPGCGNAIVTENVDRKVKCEYGCGTIFCRVCRGDYHQGDCATERREALERVAAGEFRVDPEAAQRARWDLAARDTINAISKPCPNCRAPIEKNDGCNHMTCRCGHHFCWLCMTAWGRGCQEAHWFA